MPSAETRQSFVASLLPPKQANSTFTSKDLTPIASQIFTLFGKGHPATIVKMACQAEMDSVTSLLARGKEILSNSSKPRKSLSVRSISSKDQDERVRSASKDHEEGGRNISRDSEDDSR